MCVYQLRQHRSRLLSRILTTWRRNPIQRCSEGTASHINAGHSHISFELELCTCPRCVLVHSNHNEITTMQRSSRLWRLPTLHQHVCNLSSPHNLSAIRTQWVQSSTRFCGARLSDHASTRVIPPTHLIQTPVPPRLAQR